MADSVVQIIGSCLLAAFGILMYRGKLTGLLAGIPQLSGTSSETARQEAENLGVNRVVGAAIVAAAICLFLSVLFPDNKALFGFLVVVAILAALVYANRESLWLFLKARRRSDGHN